jgi:hypothetical protein
MKKSLLLIVLLTLVAFVSGAIAATPAKEAAKPAPAAPATTAPAKLEKFSGTIKSVDAMAKSIVVAKGKVEKTFAVDESAKITKGKTDLTFVDLKAGMSTLVEYKMEGDKMIAMAIKGAAPKAAPKKK